jgi:hypothetical protein
LDASKKITEQDATWGVLMGFEHERIHLETTSVLIRELPSFMVSLPEYWPKIHPSAQ